MPSRRWTLTGPSSPSPERDEYFPVLYSTVASKAAGDARHRPQLRAGATARPSSVPVTAMSSPPPRTSSCAIRSTVLRPGFLVVVPVYRAGGAARQRRGATPTTSSASLSGVFQTNAVIDAILATRHAAARVSTSIFTPPDASADAMPVYAWARQVERGAQAEVASGSRRADLVVGAGEGRRRPLEPRRRRPLERRSD